MAIRMLAVKLRPFRQIREAALEKGSGPRGRKKDEHRRNFSAKPRRLSQEFVSNPL